MRNSASNLELFAVNVEIVASAAPCCTERSTGLVGGSGFPFLVGGGPMDPTFTVLSGLGNLYVGDIALSPNAMADIAKGLFYCNARSIYRPDAEHEKMGGNHCATG